MFTVTAYLWGATKATEPTGRGEWIPPLVEVVDRYVPERINSQMGIFGLNTLVGKGVISRTRQASTGAELWKKVAIW